MLSTSPLGWSGVQRPSPKFPFFKLWFYHFNSSSCTVGSLFSLSSQSVPPSHWHKEFSPSKIWRPSKIPLCSVMWIPAPSPNTLYQCQYYFLTLHWCDTMPFSPKHLSTAVVSSTPIFHHRAIWPSTDEGPCKEYQQKGLSLLNDRRKALAGCISTDRHTAAFAVLPLSISRYPGEWADVASRLNASLPFLISFQ